MIGYYFIIDGERHLDIPFVLIASVINGKFLHCYSPKDLEDRVLQLKEGRVDFDWLTEGGWEIREVDVPEIYVGKFIKKCSSKNKKKIRKYAREILEYADDYFAEFRREMLGHLEPEFEDYSDLYYKEEDEPGDWWKP